MTSRISVIIPNYNYGRYLAETIESVQVQTYPDVEIIVVDDGSTDDSIEVAMRYPIIVVSQPNQGVSAARNNGASLATGEYLLFLDSDDLLYPDSLEVMVGALEAAGESVGFVYGQLQYFGEKTHVFESSTFDPVELSKANYIQSSALIRRDAFINAGGFDRGFELREDWELFIRLWHAGHAGIHLPRPVIRYRKHRPKQVVRSMSKRRKRLSDVKLVWLYPAFFWRKLLTSPLRLLYHYVRYFSPGMVGKLGPTGNFTVLRGRA